MNRLSDTSLQTVAHWVQQLCDTFGYSHSRPTLQHMENKRGGISVEFPSGERRFSLVVVPNSIRMDMESPEGRAMRVVRAERINGEAMVALYKRTQLFSSELEFETVWGKGPAPFQYGILKVERQTGRYPGRFAMEFFASGSCVQFRRNRKIARNLLGPAPI